MLNPAISNVISNTLKHTLAASLVVHMAGVIYPNFLMNPRAVAISQFVFGMIWESTIEFSRAPRNFGPVASITCYASAVFLAYTAGKIADENFGLIQMYASYGCGEMGLRLLRGTKT